MMQTDPSASPRIDKTGSRKRSSAPGRACSYREVLAALQSDGARSGALSAYRAAGFTADDFATRRQARLAMLEALVSAEDVLEIAARGRMTSERLAVRDVRRRLESEVCP